jgi:hypothetical protein
MNQSIFDQTFEEPIRRRQLMPKWLVAYTWLIIAFGVILLIWTTFFAPDYNANDPQAADPKTGGSYSMGTTIGQFIPGIMITLMGLLVWLERRRAIRYNWGVAIFWTLLVLGMTIAHGPRGLTVGIFLPIFAPYWVGLYLIQRKWEKEAVHGKELQK